MQPQLFIVCLSVMLCCFCETNSQAYSPSGSVGTCVLQYSEDQTNGKLNVSIQPTTIASYFKQPSFTGPVALAYDTVVNDVDYVLYLVDKNGAVLVCPNSPNTTAVFNCSSPAIAGAGSSLLTKASSTASQLQVMAAWEFFDCSSINTEYSIPMEQLTVASFLPRDGSFQTNCTFPDIHCKRASVARPGSSVSTRIDTYSVYRITMISSRD